MIEYYTPDIKEFFVGFKYQRNDGGEWYDCTFRGYDFPDIVTMYNNSELRKNIERCGTSEKYIEEQQKYFARAGIMFAIPKGMNLDKYLSQPTFQDRIRAIKGENDYNKNLNE